MSYLGRSAKLSLKAQEKVSFLATAGQTSKTGLSYVVGFVEVILNGSTLTDVTDYTATDGNSITFLGDPLTLNDEVTVISLKTFTVADHYTISAANTLLSAKLPKAGGAMTGPITGAEFNRLSTDGTIVDLQKDGTTVGSIGTKSGSLLIGSTDTYLRVNDPSDTIFPSNSAGAERDGIINLGKGSSRFKDLYLSGGVYLGGTDSPHKLDDYEEGTWTPRFRRSNGTWVNSTKTGTWQRIGNTVHIEAEVILASNLTGTGAYVRIGGLPFAVGSGNGNGMCVLRYASQSTVPSMKWVILTEGYIFVQGSGAGSEAYNYIDSGTQTGLFGMYTV